MSFYELFKKGHQTRNKAHFASIASIAMTDGKISEDEGHHPDINFGWGYAEIKITTHAIQGLSENDFILASKIDQIINV